MRRLAVFALVTSLAATAAACANPGYDSDSLRADLVDAGLAGEEARCVVREMERRIGALRLGAREEPAPDERETFGQIVTGCLSEPPAAPSS